MGAGAKSPGGKSSARARKAAVATAIGAMAVAVGWAASPAGAFQLVSDSSLNLSKSNESPRAVVLCPGNQVALGGGMSSIPQPTGAEGGEGVYPHSYERLGAQRGWHITPVLFDPAPPALNYNVTLQVTCNKKPGKIDDPHAFAFVSPGEQKTITASCRKGKKLFSGGFQRTSFSANGGSYITASRAISKTQWQVTGEALPGFGGELVAIGYCLKKSSMTTVSASTLVAPKTTGRVTTPSCPGSRRLAAGGFNTSPTGSLLVSDGVIEPSNAWTSSAYNRGTTTGTLEAFGYCLSKNTLAGKKKK